MLTSNALDQPFYDRAHEIDALDRAWRRTAVRGQMMLLYGRRRVGKTFLLQRFFLSDRERAARTCYLLAQQTSALEQRRDAAERVLAAFPTPGVAVEDLAVSWRALLRYVSASAGTGPICLILDEFPYLVAQAPELPSLLQSWWDTEGVGARLLVVLCGSQLSAMAALGSPSAPLYGRFDAGRILLEPMRYDEVAAFYAGKSRFGPRDVLTMYGALGGTPRYHAMADTSLDMPGALVDLLFRHRSPLDEEIRFLLAGEQIRDPAPYNAVLTAIASGETSFGKIQARTGLERGSLAGALETLMELSWIRRERPFGESNDRRSIYVAADPFLTFWFRFVRPAAGERAFTAGERIWAERVRPHLADYMGRHVFEGICRQWLERHGRDRLGFAARRIGRYWSRDGQIEIDLVAESESAGMLFAECRWKENGQLDLNDLVRLKAKVAGLPNANWRRSPTFALFTTGAVAPPLRAVGDSAPDLHLVGLTDLLLDQLG
jgi:AAA+ ATPase superfamily predicted ATPase